MLLFRKLKAKEDNCTVAQQHCTAVLPAVTISGKSLSLVIL